MRLVACLLLGLTATGHAAPPGATWADWVGSYTGKLAWTGCSAPGAKTPTLALDAVDGALTIDLTPAGGGLRPLSLVEDEGRLTARQGDATLALVPRRADTIDLAIDLTSGCAIRGQLVRASTGVRACDRLVALARIEAACTKLPGPPKPPAAQRWKARDAARCTALADPIQTELVDAGCVPIADPAALVPGPACRTLLAHAATVHRCATAPPPLVQLADRLTALGPPAQDRASRATLDASCVRYDALLARAAAGTGCGL
jgi:hypothetical protein